MFSASSSRSARVALLSALALSTAGALHADPVFVNGSFENSSNGAGRLGSKTTLTGWTSSGYNFLFDSATGQAGSGGLALWGSNGLGASPDGGNYVGMDGAYETGPLSQVITGLTAGESVDVSFYYAGAQQQGFNGSTTEALKVSFGTASYTTPVLQNASHGFTGWYSETFTFIADSTSDTLSFLAIGTPTGVPPFSLLDGVAVTDTPDTAATPEPNSLLLLATGLVATAGALKRKIGKAQE